MFERMMLNWYDIEEEGNGREEDCKFEGYHAGTLCLIRVGVISSLANPKQEKNGIPARSSTAGCFC
jgi:hypothetical protein